MSSIGGWGVQLGSDGERERERERWRRGGGRGRMGIGEERGGKTRNETKTRREIKKTIAMRERNAV